MAKHAEIVAAKPEYLALQTIISESAWSIQALPRLQEHLDSLSTQHESMSHMIKQFNNSSKEKYERLSKLQHHSIKHIWYRMVGKLEEKLDVGEKAWISEFERVQVEKAKLTVLEREKNETAREVDQCSAVRTIHDQAKMDLSELLARLFSGPTPSFPSEDRLEAGLTKARHQLDNYIILQKQYSQALKLLSGVEKYLTLALDVLKETSSWSTVDIWGGGNMADYMIHSRLAQVRNHCGRANSLVTEAKSIHRNIPHIKDLTIGEDNLMFNILFDKNDNAPSDVRAHELIQNTHMKIDQSKNILSEKILPSIRSRGEELDNLVNRAQQDVQQWEGKVWEERCRLMGIVNEDVVAVHHEEEQENVTNSSSNTRALPSDEEELEQPDEDLPTYN